MRVVAALAHYPPEHRFGAPLATHALLAHLVSRGHSVTVGRTVGGGRGWTLDGVSVATTHGKSQTAALMADADVGIYHGGSSAAARIAGVAKRTVGIAHGYDATAMDADLLVYNSDHLRDLMEHSAPSIVCMPAVSPEAHVVEQTGESVTLVGLTPAKGVLTAWRIADAMPARQFLGVRGGYGGPRERIPRCRNWTTLANQADMRVVWRQTRVLLMPSAFETWGMVGVEAMCSGIPVIAHPTPGLLESLGDAGVFVDRDDVDGWVAEIRRLDDPAEYAAASAKANARVAELAPELEAGLDRFAEAVEALA